MGAHQDGDQGRAGQGGAQGERPGHHRHHQPARDHRGVEQAHRRATAQRGRLDGHAQPEHMRPDRGRGRRQGRAASQDRPAHRAVLCRHQASLAHREHPRRGRGRPERLGALRHDRHLAALAALRRQRAPHRRHERLAYLADGPGQAGLGRRPLRRRGRAALGPAAHRVVERGALQGRRSAVHRGRARGRRPRRPAGRALWADVLRAWRGQEHLRHRLLSAA
mmetsp:Transcript_20102/g.50925  ORF Transcript_20102/g.50925 Transcript_20102/m.50925 type:complete len:222 (+) Transcript_20102:124-789(+)